MSSASGPEPLSYAQAGVSLQAAEKIVERVRRAVASTRTPRVLGDIGGFAGLVSAGGYRDPVLVAATDGVGTKLLLQREAGRLRDSGVDLVGMCVNDVLTCGAEPALFLDYIAVGRLEPERVAEVIEGVAVGCREAGCALLGGETAELPDMYGADDLDLAGFALGIVERDGIVDGSAVAGGDAVIGLAASGLHANGFTLVRRLLERARLGPDDAPGDLLAPTRNYARTAAGLRAVCEVRAMAHITGGGLPGNLPRALPAGLGARIDERRWPAPAVFGWLAGLGVERGEMRRVFNGGLGFMAVVPAGEAAAAIQASEEAGCEAWQVGEIVQGEGVEYAGHG
jgi:phosphoribosylformylglycinamidine cyclo-ligase